MIQMEMRELGTGMCVSISSIVGELKCVGGMGRKLKNIRPI